MIHCIVISSFVFVKKSTWYKLINFTEILVKINFTEIVVISTEINNLERKVVLMSSQQFCMHTENTQIQNVRDWERIFKLWKKHLIKLTPDIKVLTLDQNYLISL